MNIAKQFKLHRFATVIKYVGESWRNSKFVVQQSPQTHRLHAWFSLMYWFYFYGNDFNDYCTFRFWNKTSAEKKSYVSLRRNDVLRFALSSRQVYETFLDKVKFNNRFSSYISRSWIEIGENDSNAAADFVKKHGSAIFKPRTDFGGHGIKQIKDTLACNSLRGGVLEKIIENSDCLKRLAPGSLNTVRIVTLIDKEGKLQILASVLRMGNGISFTDNYHDGGIACAIDPETGCLIGNAYGMGCTEYQIHPFSKIRFDGYKVEGFDECLRVVKKIAYEEPGARYVGWDFAITPEGIDVIEGNIPPGEDITQIAAGRGLWYEIQNLI